MNKEGGQGLVAGSRAETMTFRSRRRFANPRIAEERRCGSSRSPLTPVIVARDNDAIDLSRVDRRHELRKLNGLWLVWNLVENCHTKAPMTTRAIQNTGLFKVEFKLGPHRVSDLRVSPYSVLWYPGRFPPRSSIRQPGTSIPPWSPPRRASADSTCSRPISRPADFFLIASKCPAARWVPGRPPGCHVDSSLESISTDSD